MTWLRLDDQFAEHEKVADLTDRGFRLHVTALCYCARNSTDGILNARAVRIVSAIISRGTLKRQIDELVDAGLWRTLPDGSFEINDFLEYNPTSDEVKQLQAKRREAGRRGGKASGQAKAEANASPFASPNRSTPSRPVPKELEASISERVERSLRGVA